MQTHRLMPWVRAPVGGVGAGGLLPASTSPSPAACAAATIRERRSAMKVAAILARRLPSSWGGWASSFRDVLNPSESRPNPTTCPNPWWMYLRAPVLPLTESDLLADAMQYWSVPHGLGLGRVRVTSSSHPSWPCAIRALWLGRAPEPA